MTNTNTMTAVMLEKTIDALAAEREAWETGSYAQSNKELYLLLEKCLAFYVELKTKRSLYEKLDLLLSERGLRYNTLTSTPTKIVRLVFGDCGKRAYTYARVLDIAHKEKRENQSLASFVVDRGGIDEVRRTGSGISSADKKEAFIKDATAFIADQRAIVSFDNVPALEPDNEAVHNLCLALVRRNADGTSSVVYGLTNKALIKQALAIVGRAAADEGAAVAVVGAAKTRQTKRFETFAEVRSAFAA